MKMSLHNAKRLALLQLTNCMTSGNVASIKDLSDGTLFCSVIETIFPEVPFNLKTKEQNVVLSEPLQQLHSAVVTESKDSLCHDPEIKPGDIKKESESVLEPETESFINVTTEQVAEDEKSLLKPANSSEIIGESSSQPLIPSGDDSKPVIESVKDVNKENEDISHRYKLIEYFIDARYNLESKLFIAFPECINGNEYELAKVVIFILSEVVRFKVVNNDSIIQMLSLLDIKIQQDLEECFNFFINERDKIAESEIRKLLSSHATYKAFASPTKSPFTTPRRTCNSKYRRNDSSSISPLQESLYTDSPLKKYFESPIFTKKDILSKDKEILKTRQILYDEEVRSNMLQQTVNVMEKELKSKDKEILELKTRLRELLEENDKQKDCEECKEKEKNLKEKQRRISDLEKVLKEQESAKIADKERITKDYEELLLNFRVKVAERLTKLNYDIKQAQKENEELQANLDDNNFELLKIEEANRHLAELLAEKTKECEVYKEKSSEGEVAKAEKIPETPVSGECLGKFIEKENEELRERIKELLLLNPEKKILVDAMVQCTENSIDCDVMNNSNVSMHELPPSTHLSVNENSVPVMITAGNVNECPVVCDIVNKQDPSPKRFSGSNSAESFAENNRSSVANEGIGSLWQLYNNSMSDDGNADGLSNFSVVEKRVTKALNSLQKIGSEFPKNSKRLRVTCSPNGFNGCGRSPLIKELIEDLKSLKKSLLCLSQTEESQVQFQNNNSISTNTQVTNAKECKVVYYKCNECMKVTVESPKSAVHSTTQQYETLLLEKTQELDNLKEKFKIVKEALYLKKKECEREINNCTALNKENVKNCIMLKHIEMKCQSLESELVNMREIVRGIKSSRKREKYLWRMQKKEWDKGKIILEKRIQAKRVEIEVLSEKNQKLEEDVAVFRKKCKELSELLKSEKEKNQEQKVPPKIEPEFDTSMSFVPYARGFTEQPLLSRETKHCVIKQEPPLIVKEEPFSPDEYEGTSLSIDESALNGALYSRSLQNPFHLHSADEESFLNHSSLAGLSRNFESGEVQTRKYELNRRNTLCMPHLKSCYPAEHVALTPADKKKLEGIKKEYEIESREPCGKKRKASEIKFDDQSVNLLTTPAVKAKRRFKTPSSLQKVFDFRRSGRPGSIKPKP